MGLIHFAEHVRPIASTAMLTLAIVACPPNFAKADEGGVSMWVPGFFGSLAATPFSPDGRSRPSTIIHRWTRAVRWQGRG
jgi:hypothetical protein